LKKWLGLTYLPGGDDKYIDSLTKCLEFVRENSPSKEELTKWFLQTFRSVESIAVVKSCIRTIEKLDLIVRSKDKFSVSDVAKEFLQTSNNDLVYQKLKANYVGIEDILEILSEKPHSVDEVLVILKGKTGTKWRSKRQVAIRLNWLLNLRLVTKIGQRYQLAKEMKDIEGQIEQQRPEHDAIRDMIVEIGKAYDCDTKKEYPLNGEKLDVLWKKLGQLAAWEVHFEANLHKALSKLKQALLWLNAEPRLVTTQEGQLEAKKLLETSFHELKDALIIEHWEEIINWYNSAKPSADALQKFRFKHDLRFRSKGRKG